MYTVVLNTMRSHLIGSSLAVAGVIGMSGLGYAAMSAKSQAARVTAERDSAQAELQKLQETAGQLAQIEQKIGSARVEYSRVVQAWADTQQKVGAAQQNLAALAKRQEQAADRVSQTGSIKSAEPPKRPAR